LFASGFFTNYLILFPLISTVVVKLTPVATTPVANLATVSMTLAANFATGTAGVVYTGGK
jgi:hypothetical protein